MNRRLNLPAAVVIAALVCLAGIQAFALQQTAPRPGVIATANLEKVFEGINERARVDEELTRVGEDLEAESARQAGIIEELREEVDLFPAGSEKHQDAQRKLQLAALEYRAFQEFSTRKLEIQRAMALKRIYLSIKQAARELSEERGYDIVFVDDSLAEMTDGTEADVRRQISGRRMLYTSPGIEITAELIERMNR